MAFYCSACFDYLLLFLGIYNNYFFVGEDAESDSETKTPDYKYNENKVVYGDNFNAPVGTTAELRCSLQRGKEGKLIYISYFFFFVTLAFRCSFHFLYLLFFYFLFILILS